MNILYDSQIFSYQKFGGISRYFVELMSNLPNDIHPINSILLSDNEYLRRSQLRNKGIYIPSFRGKQRMIKPLNNLYSTLKIHQNQFQVFHPTYYNPYFLKQLKKPYVLTVHDMTHELFNSNNSVDNTILYKKETIEKADKIIAISENTKKDLINIYNVNEDKIHVIYLGYNQYNHYSKSITNLPPYYILFVGQRNGYKNFSTLLHAFAQVNRIHNEIKLICTGTAFTTSELNLISSLKLSKHVRHYFATDEEMAYLYQNAVCFVYPSLYEGFGIPILEAFAAKCPLALSNSSCFPEIAGNAGLYFDPNDSESIAYSILTIIENNDVKDRIVTAGCAQLNKYSWGKMANQIADIYRIFE